MPLQRLQLSRLRGGCLEALSPRSPRPCMSIHAVSPRAPVSPRAEATKQCRWAGKGPHNDGVAVLSATGRHNGSPKAVNQDTYFVEALHLSRSSGATLIGVFDGHGSNGHLIAQQVSHSVATASVRAARAVLDLAAGTTALDGSLSWEDPQFAGAGNMSRSAALAAESVGTAAELDIESARRCLEETFRAAEETVESSASTMALSSGSTAVVCMVLPDSVVAAWAGDSRAVLGSANGDSYTVTRLTQDHKPNNLQEMARIVKSGGRVTKPNPRGPYRVCKPGGTSPGLSVARAFGDLQLSAVGVVPTPDIAVFPRSSPCSSAGSSSAGCSSSTAARPSDVLVVATDGLWEQVSSDEAVELAGSAGNAQAAAALLLQTAEARWAEAYGGRHQDDITVAVAFL